VKLFDKRELVIIAVTYALMGALLVMLLTGCTYVDVYTHDVTIQGEIGR